MNNPICQTPNSSVILRIVSVVRKGYKEGLNDVPCTSKIQIKRFQLIRFFLNATKKSVSQITDFHYPKMVTVTGKITDLFPFPFY